MKKMLLEKLMKRTMQDEPDKKYDPNALFSQKKIDNSDDVELFGEQDYAEANSDEIKEPSNRFKELAEFLRSKKLT